MSKTITMMLDAGSIRHAIRELNDYKKSMERKANELVQKLASMGAQSASIGYAGAAYDGNNDISVRVEQRGQNVCAVVAAGSTVLFIEFGAGIRFGYGHPQAAEFGYGPGTYPSVKGNWDNPHGWWIPGGEHTYGNPPSMTMYYTAKELESRVLEVAREVFSA